jgi:hypothetical protein
LPVAQAEHFIERGDAGARHGLLLRETGIPQRAAIVLAELGERQLADGDAGMRPLAKVGIDVRVVNHHQHVVFGDSYIHFEHVGAGLDGVFKSGHGVLRTQGAGAAMTVDKDARHAGWLAACVGSPVPGKNGDRHEISR